MKTTKQLKQELVALEQELVLLKHMEAGLSEKLMQVRKRIFVLSGENYTAGLVSQVRKELEKALEPIYSKDYSCKTIIKDVDAKYIYLICKGKIKKFSRETGLLKGSKITKIDVAKALKIWNTWLEQNPLDHEA